MRLRIPLSGGSREELVEAVTFETRPLHPKSRFQDLLTAVLDGGAPDWPDGTGEPAALSRRWWEQRPGPPGSKEEVWEKLEQEGILAEIASWSECGNFAWLQTLLGRLVVDHQYRKALMVRSDPLPAPWGTLGFQAVAALWKIGRVAVSTAEGGGQVDNSRAQVKAWFEVLPQARAGWGDLIIVHKLAPVFERWALKLRPEIASAEMGLDAAKAFTKLRREQESKVRWWWDRAAAKLRTKQAEYAETVAESRLKRLQSAQAWLREAGGKWAAADAIGKLPAFGDGAALPLPPPGPRVEGLDMWAVREAAHHCPHTPAALVQEHAVMRTVFGRRLGLEGLAGSAELWRNRRLAIEVYRIWFGLLPPSSNSRPLVTLLARTSDDQMASYRRFFAPWRSLHRARRQPAAFGDEGAYNAAAERVFLDIGEEFETLRIDLTSTCRGPLRASEFATWGGSRQAWFRAHLDAIGVEGHTFEDKVWPRLLELARFYRRWGELTATAHQVREAGSGGAGSHATRTLLLPWRRLQAAHLVAQMRGQAATDLQQEFLEIYAMPQWIREKLDDLWSLLGSSPAATEGAA